MRNKKEKEEMRKNRGGESRVVEKRREQEKS